MTLRTELTRFRVRTDKWDKAREWMAFLRANLPAVLETLEGEKMYVETIFHEEKGGAHYLYWYSVQGEGGIAVTDSEHAVDRTHMEFWRECIDPAFPAEDLDTEVVMIPEKIRSLMN